MRTRRGTTSRLRGWGGVATMGAACALTATLVVALPRGADGDSGRAPNGSQRVSEAAQARVPGAPRADAKNCVDQSPRASTDDGPTIDEIKKRKVKKLIVGVDQNSLGWGYRDPNKPGGELEGFDIDLAHAIAKEILGDPEAVLFRAIPTNQRIPALKNKQVDMVVRTMTINCERLKDVAFSTPYFETGQQVLAPKTSTAIKGYDDSLKGKKVCSAEGSIALEELQKDSKGADISTTVPNQLDCLVRLQLGEVDAVVTDSALGASQAAQDPTVELKDDKPFTTEFYGVAMNKDATDLVKRVNAVLEDYRKDDNGWKKSYDDWLKDNLGGKTASPPAAQYGSD
ncbi:glutamate ABC transporter substrate-binding protein [Streptomyces sp. NPDC059009]|uniref:glutamate ABC transporter substrate-binding protein n=1 Tax=Streptomyces sp. NPDC059009 TaxID=3346694 RepID=UPI0036BB4C57